MVFFYALLFGFFCLFLLFLFMVWDKLHYGSFAPHEDFLINWPVGHELYKYNAEAQLARAKARRMWRDKPTP